MLDSFYHMTLKLLLNRVFGPMNDFHIICIVIFTLSVLNDSRSDLQIICTTGPLN